MNKFRRVFVIFWQIFSYLVAYVPLRTIFYFKKRLPGEGNTTKKPLIIVANHKNVFDPWFITFSLPLKQYIRLTPIRFLGTSSPKSFFLRAIYWIIIYPFIYWPNGVIILPPRGRDGNLTIEDKTRSSIEALNDGDALVLFAEGGIKKKPGVAPFKRGPAYIQKKTGAPILCVSIKFEKYWWLPWHKRILNWDTEFTYIPEDIIDDEVRDPEWLRRKVVALYEAK